MTLLRSVLPLALLAAGTALSAQGADPLAPCPVFRAGAEPTPQATPSRITTARGSIHSLILCSALIFLSILEKNLITSVAKDPILLQL